MAAERALGSMERASREGDVALPEWRRGAPPWKEHAELNLGRLVLERDSVMGGMKIRRGIVGQSQT
jgi:hypothetical protein